MKKEEEIAIEELEALDKVELIGMLLGEQGKNIILLKKIEVLEKKIEKHNN